MKDRFYSFFLGQYLNMTFKILLNPNINWTCLNFNILKHVPGSSPKRTGLTCTLSLPGRWKGFCKFHRVEKICIRLSLETYISQVQLKDSVNFLLIIFILFFLKWILINCHSVWSILMKNAFFGKIFKASS